MKITVTLEYDDATTIHKSTEVRQYSIGGILGAARLCADEIADRAMELKSIW